MTVNKLYKLLGHFIKQGNGRVNVSVHKESFHDNRESDGCIILPVDGAEVVMVLQCDDDGGIKTRANGQECYRRTLVIYGCDYISQSKLRKIRQ